MIVFFDTSAMVKRYFAEIGSDAVTELWSSASLIVASQLLYAEMIATFARKLREEPNNSETIAQLQQAFRADFLTLTQIAIDDDVHRRVDDILGRHPTARRRCRAPRLRAARARRAAGAGHLRLCGWQIRRRRAR